MAVRDRSVEEEQGQPCGIQLETRYIDVCRKGKLILTGVSFQLQPATLTAIIGPNGAGKTTLMRALTGERPDSGQVLINDEDMYADPEYWLRQIGYVPVENVLHEQLSLQEALWYIARLRLPAMSTDEIEERVDTLLTDFGFPRYDEQRQRPDARRQTPIRNLSSGERKRANICAELISDPPILMLDEPTSNLDPNAERDVMHLLHDYAHHRGTTVLVITHTLNTIDVCDEVIYIENAHLRVSGSPEQVLEQLECDVGRTQGESLFYRWAHVFQETRTRPDRRPCHRSGGAQPTAARRDRHGAVAVRWFFQLRWLLRRYTRVRLADKGSLIGTLLAGFSGVMFFVLPRKTLVKPFDDAEVGLAIANARQSIYVIALVVTLIGLITSYTEISKEFRIYRHERLKGLSPSAYFMSKWLWLTVAVGILAPITIVAFIVLVWGQPLPGFPTPRIHQNPSWWEYRVHFQLAGFLSTRSTWLVLATLLLACITSVTLGLLISAAAGDGGRGYLYLSFVVVFIVLFSGLIQNETLEDLTDRFSMASTGRWAYEGVASAIGIYCWQDSWRFNEFNSTGHLVSVWLALGVFFLVSAFLTILVLRVRDPWYRWWKNLLQLVAREWRSIMLGMAAVTLLMSYTVFLRQRSHEYHSLNYYAGQEYGGTNAIEYPKVEKAQELDALQYWNGRISQTWCAG